MSLWAHHTRFVFFWTNRKVIIELYTQSAGKPKTSWQNLQKFLPELYKEMSHNTFKQYVSVLVVASHELDMVIQKLGQAVRQNTELQDLVEDLDSQSMI